MIDEDEDVRADELEVVGGVANCWTGRDARAFEFETEIGDSSPSVSTIPGEQEDGGMEAGDCIPPSALMSPMSSAPMVRPLRMALETWLLLSLERSERELER